MIAGVAPATVFLCFDTLGDLTLRQPLFSAVLNAGRRVFVVVRRGFDGLVPLLDPRLQVLTTDLDPYRSPGEAAREAAGRLRDEIARLEPSCVVSAPFDRTWIDEWLLRQLPGTERVGFAREAPLPHFVSLALRVLDPPRASEPLTRAVEAASDAHEIDRNRALMQGILGRSDAAEPVLTLPEAVLRATDEVLRRLDLEPGRYAIGCLGGRTALKAWPTESYVSLLAALWERQHTAALVVGVEHEAPLLASVCETATGRGIGVRSWIGGPDEMDVLVGLVARARLYVGCDTGPMHFAAALGKPVLARFGGGHWPRFLPLAQRSFVATRRLPCFGCGWHCWLGAPECVSGVSDETLLAGLDWLLGSAPDERRVDLGPDVATMPAVFLERALTAARDRLGEAARALETAESESQARMAALERVAQESRERGEALERIDRESRERGEALERIGRESRERGEALERLAAEARAVASSLEQARPRGPLDALLPLRWLRLNHTVGLAVARLRGLVG